MERRNRSRLDGTRISAGISYKKLRLLEPRTTYLTEFRKEAALPPLHKMQGFLRRISMIDTLLSVDWTGIVLWICVVALILCGVAGTVVPALPGIPMIFLGALLAAWIGDFQHITWVPLVVLGVLTIIGLAVDWVAQTMGAQRAGASKWGIMGSLVGTVAGLFMGIVGILFMPLVGAFIGEYIAQRDLRIAGNVGWATWVGMMVGTVVKLGLSFVMIGIMCFALWF